MDTAKWLSKRIRDLRIRRGMSVPELARAAALTESTVYRLETEGRPPRFDTLLAIAEALKIDVSDLVDQKADHSSSPGFPLPKDAIPVPLNDTVLVPLIGEVSAGPGILAEQNIEYLHRLPKTFIPAGNEDSCFLLRARGESMIDAGIQDGDLLFICNAVEVDDGDIAVLLVDDEAVVKRVYRKNGTLMLVSENPAYPPREVDQAFLIGRVMWIRRNF